MPHFPPRRSIAASTPLGLLAMVSLVLVASGYWYYRAETAELVDERYQIVAAIGELKAQQISDWRLHLLDHAETATRRFEAMRSARHVDEEDAWASLSGFELRDHHEATLLLSPDGNRLAGDDSSSASLDAATMAALRDAERTRAPALSPLFRLSNGDVHIDAVVPVTGPDGQIRAYLVYRTSARDSLYPLLRTWPTPSPSAETVLTASDGDEVVFLNDLRHRPGLALQLRYPRASASLPSARAVAGARGRFIGPDYRGVEVVADLRAIDGSPWFLVSKVDLSELLVDARERAVTITLVLVLLLGLLAAAVAYVARRRQAAFYAELYEAERRSLDASQTARRELETSEERLRLALRAANQGLYDLNVQTGDAEVTPEYPTMLGYDPATFRETNAAWIDRLHPDDRGLVAQKYVDYVSGRLSEYRVEFRQRTADGQWKWILSVGKIVSRHEDGRPLRMLGIHADITERKTAEARIQRLAQLYATLSQCNSAIVRSAGEAELFPQVCQAAVVHGGMKMAWVGMVDPGTHAVVPVASHGDDHHYLVGLHVSVDASHPVGRGPTGTAIREGRAWWCQDFANDPATAPWHERGARAGWRASAALPLFRDGRPVGALTLYADAVNAFDEEARKLLTSMAADIGFALDSFAREHARRRAEEETRAATAQLEATLDAVPDLLFELGLDGRYYDYRSPSEDLLAAPPDVFIGRTVGEVLPPAQAALVMSALDEAHRLGRSGPTVYRLDLPRGEAWFELSVARKVVAGGEAPRFILLARDITERKAAEAHGRRLEGQLQQSQKMEAIGRLAGGLAHDFNNLLTIINGRADLALAELPAGHPLHADLDDIRQAGERAASLTRQLLTVSRRQVVSPEVLSLPATVAGMRSMLQRMVSEDIRLETHIDETSGSVRADPGQLEQVLLNLVVNARDAMPQGGTLSIDVRAFDLDEEAAAALPPLAAGRYVRLAVGDSGVGIDEATRARIFEPFFTTKGPGQGTGLGLSTAYSIVSQCGGTIVVDSNPGRGSTFSVYLPHVDAVAAPAPTAPDRALARGAETILLVDDEKALVGMASRILTYAGYTVLTATDGEQALDVLAQHDGHVDLLLTDVVIPGMSGRELAERVVQRVPAIKVLYSSGYTDDEVLLRGVESNQAHFIAKPYSIADLTRKVREVLDGESVAPAEGRW